MQLIFEVKILKFCYALFVAKPQFNQNSSLYLRVLFFLLISNIVHIVLPLNVSD